MRYLSRRLLLCAVIVMIMALFAGGACAEAKGTADIPESSEETGVLLQANLVDSEDWTSGETLSGEVVLTLPAFTMSGDDGSYTISVSYDLSAIIDSADSSFYLTFYYDYLSGDEGISSAVPSFGITPSDIHSFIVSHDSGATSLGGTLTISLNSGDVLGSPAVVVNASDFSIDPVSAEIPLITGKSLDVTLTALSAAGSVTWEIISSYDLQPDGSTSSTSSRAVKSSITSSGNTAVLTLTAPSSAYNGQTGYIAIEAIDQTTGAAAYSEIIYDVASVLELTLSTTLVSVDFNGSERVGLNVKGESGDVTYSTNEQLWTSFASSTNYSRDVIVSPYNSILEGKYWPVELTVQDSRCTVSQDPRGMATITLTVYSYAALSLDASSTEFTISSSDVPDVTFTALNASGDLSFDVSVSWAAVSDSKFVLVSSPDTSLMGTTQAVTVTAKDDRGRAGNTRGESSLTLNVTISNDFVPALELAVSPSSLTVEQDGTAAASLTASNAIGEVSYESSASYAVISGDTITVTYDSAYASTDQTVTITATDAGRSADKTATAELVVTFGVYVSPDISPDESPDIPNTPDDPNTPNTPDDPNTPDTPTPGGDDTYTLSLSTGSSTVSVKSGSSETVDLTLSGAGSAGVEWGYSYTSSPNNSDTSDNPLGLTFSETSSTSAVLSVNPSSTAVPGTYTVSIMTSTTSGTSTGGTGSITVTVSPSEALSVSPESENITRNIGEAISLVFYAVNNQGTVRWSITDTSWADEDGIVSLALSSREGSTVTVAGSISRSGHYSFTLAASDDVNSASSSVDIYVSGGSVIIDNGNTEAFNSRADKVPSVSVRAAEITPAVAASIRSILGLTESDEIRTLTSENILDPVSPDLLTEGAMNNRGYLLAANLSRITVEESGIYAFVFTVPSDYVGYSMNDLSVFSAVLERLGVSASDFMAAAEDGLTEGKLLGTNGQELTTAANEMLAVVDLEGGTTSGTFFTSVVVPDEERLPELTISTITQESFDEVLPELIRNTSLDSTSNVQRLLDEQISQPREPSEETTQAISDAGYTLDYKLNSLSADRSAYYVFEITVPDEYVGMKASDFAVFLVNNDGDQVTGSIPGIVNGFINSLEFTEVTGIKFDTLPKKILAVGLLQAGQSFSVYLGKILLMLLAGGCSSGMSYAGMGMIALAGAVIVLAGMKFSRRR